MSKNKNIIDAQSIYQSAVTLHQHGEINQAINLYSEVLQHFPDIAEIHYNLGLALFDAGKYQNAVESYKRAIEINSNDSDIHFNLGLAYKVNNQYDEAEEAYLNALEFAEDSRDILYNLGCCYQDSGATEQACLVFDKLLELFPEHLSALNNLAYLEHLQKNFDRARELYGRVLVLDPNRQSAKHMYAALSGDAKQAPPQEYIRDLFDQYSDNFEEDLVNNLEYNTYCILRQAFEVHSRKKSREHCLDLGCGTGLAGEAFQDVSSRISGIDLSQKMIEQAAEKNLYHELHCCDVIDFLHNTDQQYDLIVAADVLPYLGDLEPLFSAAVQRATDDVLFCLSSEWTEEQNWKLQNTGRYAHNPDYVSHIAGQNGLTVQEQFPANIRKEDNAWIKGMIFILCKDPSKHTQ